ncbi:MAG: hypothetical protein KAT71_03490 [Gammaproteobacteria bacterium]|nr:hypothetical protein [Gammaproteobacteria bacterium]
MGIKSHIIKIIFCFLLSLVITGCATPHMSAADKAKIKNINIDNKIKVPNLTYTSQGEELADTSAGVLGAIMPIGALGAAVVAGGASVAAGNSVANPTSKELMKLAADNNIHIDQIVVKQISSQIEQNTQFKISSIASADAKMLININYYGLSASSAFSSKIYPVLSVDIKVVLADGKVIWKDRIYVSELTAGTPACTLAAIKQNPQLLSVEWNAAANKVAKDFVKAI